ncbi:MAG: 16S rRNA (uracil(1498)-N(3))-methyltransferase [Nitrospiraceae bacterium]|jgi:16S rRNA (uracil1498-N3)-methyltransferase|nr:16S rRNA (uracil(1498)-N(3))-methyltransferase [Nitrospiraceae bacterium]
MRIHVPSADIARRTAVRLSDEKAHHVLSVMRAAAGTKLVVFDGEGRQYQAAVSGIQKKAVFIDIIDELPNATELDHHYVLCAAILKGEKMDMVVQKATELGVMEIQPIVSERTVVKETRRLDRWRKIAEESCEQCGRSKLPVIHEPVAWKDFFAQHARLSGFVFWEEGGLPLAEAYQAVLEKRLAANAWQPVHVVIGPEGGMTHEEIGCAAATGLMVTTLGRRILRAETAAIVALGLVQYVFEG